MTHGGKHLPYLRWVVPVWFVGVLCCLPVSFAWAQSDLAIDAIKQVPAKALPNQTLNLEFCFINKGGVRNPIGFKVSVFLSKDKTITTQDLNIHDFLVQILIPPSNGTHCHKETVTIPAVPPTGAVYLGAIVDSDNRIQEVLETNNTLAVPISFPGADLVVDTITGVPLSGQPNQQVSVNVCIKNIGQADLINAFRVAVVHSTDSKIEPFDHLIADVSIGSIKAGARLCRSFSGKLAATLVPGKNWIGALVDSGEVIDEEREDNNTLSQTFSHAAPDLLLLSFSGTPPTAKPGAPLALRACLKNIGQVDARKVVVAFYHSEDATINPNLDTFLGSNTIAIVPAGASVCTTVTTKLPSALQKRNNWLGVVLDPFGEVDEISEQNNTDVARFLNDDIVPDLEILTFTGLPVAATPGTPMTLTLCVINKGSGDALPFRVSLYLSLDDQIEPQKDFEVVYFDVVGLAKGANSCRVLNVDVPATLPPEQSSWFGLVADSLGVLRETNKSNNVQKKPFFVKKYDIADYEVNTLTLSSSSLKVGESVTITSCVTNNGKGEALPFEAQLYFSRDTSLDREKDQVLATMSVAKRLKQGEQECLKFIVKVPPGVMPGGSHSFGIFVDPKEHILELEENNNAKVVSFTVAAFSLPDLVIDSISGVPGVMNAEQSFTAQVCVENKGPGSLNAPFEVALYYAADGQFATSSAVELGRVTSNAGVANQRKLCVTIPAKLKTGLPGGKGFVGAIVDPSDLISETSQANNTSQAKTLRLKGPDLVFASLTLTPSQGFPGASMQVEVCLRNSGTTDVSKPFVIELLDTGDPTNLSTATKIGEITYSAVELSNLRPGLAADCKTALPTIPQLPAGRRFLVAVADRQKILGEEKVENNTLSRPYVVRSNTLPNLTVLSASAQPAWATLSDKVDVEICIFNGGTATTQQATLTLYFLSSRTDVPQNKLADTSFAALQASGQACTKLKVPIPLTASLGTRWLAAEIDSGKVITEANEIDNVFIAPIELLRSLDQDQDGVPYGVDCEDNNDKVFPAHQGKPASKEICDGVDNDCNGQIDEDFPRVGALCEVGEGACKRVGNYVCNTTFSDVVCNAVQGKPEGELCNLRDDDCNGLIDDSESACESGFLCVKGQCIKAPTPEPTQEGVEENPVDTVGELVAPDGGVLPEGPSPEPLVENTNGSGLPECFPFCQPSVTPDSGGEAGCGCATSSGAAGMWSWLMMVLWLAALGWRRRQAHPAQRR